MVEAGEQKGQEVKARKRDTYASIREKWTFKPRRCEASSPAASHATESSSLRMLAGRAGPRLAAQALRIRRSLRTSSAVGKFRIKWMSPEGARHGWTFGLPSEKGFEDEDKDEDIPWKERWTQIKKDFRSEWDDWVAWQKWERWRRKYGSRFHHHECMLHGDVLVEFPFNDPKTFERFQTGSDARVGAGKSECELVATEEGTAIFRGDLDTQPPADGRSEIAGWCTMKSKTLVKPFTHSIHFFEDWQHFTHLILRVRGDGRTYMVNLNCSDRFDYTWGDLWTFPLFTSGGPYWQTVKIPFSKFYRTVYGRIQNTQYAVLQQDDEDKWRWERVHRESSMNAPIRAVGITLQDRIDGPFRLELDFVGVYYDITHFEICKYEHYKTKWLAMN